MNSSRTTLDRPTVHRQLESLFHDSIHPEFRFKAAKEKNAAPIPDECRLPLGIENQPIFRLR